MTPLELFFDLVFVLALTQCTTLIDRTPTWEGVLKGMLVLGVVLISRTPPRTTEPLPNLAGTRRP